MIMTLWKCRFSNFHEDYMSPQVSNAIKGFFAVVILFSHMRGYIVLSSNIADKMFSIILDHTGQLMVAMYFFYSGYGILDSINRKNKYFENYPRRRIIKTLIHFDLAVLFYFILMTFIGVYYPASNYITCWIGWGSLGNSNWFVFDILVLYVLVYFAHFSIRKCSNKHLYLLWMSIMTSVLSLIMWIALKLSAKGSWWIDTIITFPLGMWFALYKNQIDVFIRCKKVGMSIVVLLVLAFVFWHVAIGNDVFGFCACIFCLMLVALFTRIRLDNKFLQWLGVHSFAIYIIQRLPMNLFQHLGMNVNPYAFAFIAIPSVLLLAWGLNTELIRLDRKFINQ